MEMDNSGLRSAFQRGPNCPSIEALASWLGRPAGSLERRESELHLAGCLHCQTEIALLRRFEEGAIGRDEEAAVAAITARLAGEPVVIEPKPAPGWWQRRWNPPRLVFAVGSVAALALIAAGLTSQLRLRRPLEQPVPQFSGGATRAAVVDIIPSPDSFAWKPVSGADRYELTVRTVDDAVIFHNFFTATTLVFPPEVVAVKSSRKLLLWEVVARDAAGAEIARSGVQRLQQRFDSMTPEGKKK
jgi:hypothetical protein